MNCSSLEALLESAFDGELEPTQLFQIHQHLESCGSCSTAFGDLQRLQTEIRGQSLYHPAPDLLRTRIQASLKQQTQVQPQQVMVKRKPLPWRWMAIAASVLLVISSAGNLLLSNRTKTERQLIAQEIISGHIRSMLNNHQVDVVSSDRHTVKPWFSDKLDFAPDVKDLAPQGFPLLGGRVDYINHQRVAALVFGRSKHVINLFTWPAPPSKALQTSQNGYHLLAWNRDGMIYWAISDVSLDELERFAHLYGWESS